MKKLTGAPLAILAIFVLWTVMDFVIHGLILGKYYQALLPLTRPVAEMPVTLLNVLMLGLDLMFVGLFRYLEPTGNRKKAVIYGVVLGLGFGGMIGWGTWAAIPIPLYMAWVWFLGTWAEFALAGVVLALSLKRDPQAG